MASLGTAISAGANVISSIFSLFGGGSSKASKRAASIARRQTDALRAVQVLQPLSGLISQSLWDRIQNGFLRAAQNGLSYRTVAPLICEGGFEFATQARDLILRTPPSAVLRKRGGFPSWTDLGKDVVACVDAGIRSGALRPKSTPPPVSVPTPPPVSVPVPSSPSVSIPPSEPVAITIPVPAPVPQTPTVVDLGSAVEAQPLPGTPTPPTFPSSSQVIVLPSPPVIPRESPQGPTFIPFPQVTTSPAPRTTFVPISGPAPTVVQPEKSDNSVLLLGGLALAGLLIFMRR